MPLQNRVIRRTHSKSFITNIIQLAFIEPSTVISCLANGSAAIVAGMCCCHRISRGLVIMNNGSMHVPRHLHGLVPVRLCHGRGFVVTGGTRNVGQNLNTLAHADKTRIILPPKVQGGQKTSHLKYSADKNNPSYQKYNADKILSKFYIVSRDCFSFKIIGVFGSILVREDTCPDTGLDIFLC